MGIRLLTDAQRIAFKAIRMEWLPQVGTIAIVPCDRERSRDDSGIPDIVDIDGRPYRVLGNPPLRHMAGPIAKGEPIGLIVRELAHEQPK